VCESERAQILKKGENIVMNETKKNQTNETKRQLSLPRIVTGLKAGQQTLAKAMPPGGF
jgi:hypothetical protein